MSDMGEPSVFPMEPESGTSGRQYRLALRGNSLNPMIDAATPLLGMVMRLSTMNSQAMPEHLFAQVVTDVQAVEQLLQEQGYEPGVIVSFRYILCTFIDEAALGNRALRSHWFVRENGTLLESSRGLSGIDEIKQLFGAKTLTVDTGADNAAGKLTFNIDGLARVIAPLRDACHWAGE
ncbi:TPA: hypothetical protein IRR23_005079 [Escherichia coli]|nr:hypothetical protein [Escherichia coli]